VAEIVIKQCLSISLLLLQWSFQTVIQVMVSEVAMEELLSAGSSHATSEAATGHNYSENMRTVI